MEPRTVLARSLEVLILTAAALLEVGGDAAIRKGLQGRGAAFVVTGALVLGAYGLVVNLLKLDFSRLLGAYVGIFALVSVAAGRFVFHEAVARSTWLGLAVILVGSAIIQWGPR